MTTACRIICDFCGAFTAEFRSVAQVVAAAEKQGWDLVVRDRKSLHRCPKCKAQGRLKK